MTVFNVQDAKTHLSKLLTRVMSGEEIIIAKAGKPVAMLSPFAEMPTRRMPAMTPAKSSSNPISTTRYRKSTYESAVRHSYISMVESGRSTTVGDSAGIH